MAFIGKSKRGAGEGSKADVAVKVSCSANGRLGVVFRNGLIPEGTMVDVKVGIEEDYGKLMVVFGGETASPVKSLGHNGNSTSWSAIRSKATKALPEMTRRPCIVLEKADTFILIDMQLGNPEVVEETEEVVAPVEAASFESVEGINLGL